MMGQKIANPNNMCSKTNNTNERKKTLQTVGSQGLKPSLRGRRRQGKNVIRQELHP
jgi:hypothetical protein